MSLNLFARYMHDQIKRKVATWEHEKKLIPLEKKQEKDPFILAKDIFEDAMPMVESDNFFAISFLGNQGKGKSYTASLLATYAEENDFLVIYAKAEDILPDKDAWVESVKSLIEQSGTIYLCLVLDDMSYSVGGLSAKKQSEFKHFVGDIRHVFEKVLGKIKIFIIYISHRLHSLPPMLRNSGTWIFVSMLPEDRADALKLIPRQKEERDRLELLYKFLGEVQNKGPKFKKLKFVLDDVSYTFEWGSEENPGDGRLYMSFHNGHLAIFQSKSIPKLINLNDRHMLVPKPPPISEEERQEKIKKAAAELFQVVKKEES